MANEESALNNNDQPDVNVDETTDSSVTSGASSADDIAQAALNAAENAVDSLRDDYDNENNNDNVGNEADAATAAMFAEFNANNPETTATSSTGSNSSSDGSQPVKLPEFNTFASDTGAVGIELLSQVNLNVRIELGRTKLLVEDVLKLNEGSVVELDKLAGDPVDVYVNDRHVARGEVLVLNDSFCVRISEIVSQPDVCVVDSDN